jgi:hypothetical protein
MVEHSFTSKGFRIKIGLNTDPDPGELLDPDPEPGEQIKADASGSWTLHDG